ncbi:hypothetical protein, partial [Neoroseomonas alkaliterrae]|uniref:hypothetical protein n=1 Tax=Neoroseomonas alkaliterrae TaxID=1452450 RepID=UPI001BADA5BF
PIPASPPLPTHKANQQQRPSARRFAEVSCCAKALATWMAHGRAGEMVVALRNLRAGKVDLAEELSSLFDVTPGAGSIVLLRPRALGRRHGAHLNFLIQRWQLDVR